MDDSSTLTNPTEVPLSALTTIWDCHKIRQSKNSSGASITYCDWCPLDKNGHSTGIFKGHNATKMLAHVMSIPGCGIQKCAGNILPQFKKRYRQLQVSQVNANTCRNNNYVQMNYSIDDLQRRTVSSVNQDSVNPSSIL